MKIDNTKKLGLAGITAILAMAAPLSAGDSKEQTRQDKGMHANSTSSSQNQVKASSEIIGMDILTTNGDKIGQVEDIFIDLETGKILAVVTSTGGFLGLGTESSLLSTEDLRFDGEQKQLRTDLSKDQLLGATTYNEGDTPQFENVRPLGKSAETRRETSNRGVIKTTHQNELNSNHSNLTDSGLSTKREADRNQGQAAANKLAVTDFVGMNVENYDGEEIGSIDKLFVDFEQGQVLGVVVSTGGFLGMGAHQNVLALNELNYNAGNETLLVDLNQEQLRSAPTYTDNDSSWQDAVQNRFNKATAGNSQKMAKNRATDQSDQNAANRPTVFNQGNSSAETKMTADIRKSILDNNSMSSRADNVTIITQGKQVLLRGNVDSAAEKSAIEKIAQTQAGRTNVTSELVVRTL